MSSTGSHVPAAAAVSRALAFATFLVGIAPALAQQPQGEPAPPFGPEEAEALAAMLDFADQVRPSIDRSSFDLAALLDRLDYDLETIESFVRDEIELEPYAGSLRGARGTLLSRAGNALDQALLLATLAKDAGYEAVIRSGELSTEDGSRLIAHLRPVAARPPSWQRAAIDTAALDYVKRSAGAPGVGSTAAPGSSADAGSAAFGSGDFDALLELARRDRDAILGELSRAGVALGDGDLARRIADETRSYYWVDLREGPAQAWRSVHPAFGGDAAPAVTASRSFANEIPPELTHRVRLEILVGQRLGSKVDSRPLMQPIEVPSPTVAAGAMTLLLVPDQFLRKDALDTVEELVPRTRFLIPIVNGGLPEGGQALALDGTLVPPDVLAMGAAGLFQEVSDKMETAATLIRDLGREEPASEDLKALEWLRLRVTFLAPGGEERIETRDLFRAANPADAAEAAETAEATGTDPEAAHRQLVRRLARSYELAIVTGSYPPEYVLDSTLAYLQSRGPLLRALADPSTQSCNRLDCLPEIKAAPDAPEAPHTSLVPMYAQFDRPDLEPGVRRYRSAPNLTILSYSLLSAGPARAGTLDIVRNTRRAFRFSNGAPVAAPDALVLSGVWDTYVEAFALGYMKAESALSFFAAAESAGVDLMLVRPDAGARTWLPPTEGALLARDLSAGYAGILPARPLASGPSPGWWRVHPASGETLGMTSDGGAVEFLILGMIGGEAMRGIGRIAEFSSCFFDGPPDVRPTRRRLSAYYPTISGCVTCSNVTWPKRRFMAAVAAVSVATRMDSLSDVADSARVNHGNAQRKCLLQHRGYARGEDLICLERNGVARDCWGRYARRSGN